ncbi:MAG: EamA family transporter [Pseudomonadota bacterium]
MTALLWIPISMFAALMQVVRTAGQKQLNAHLSTMTVTYVRSLFGLPFLLVYLLIVESFYRAPLPAFANAFWMYVIGAAVAQVAATWLLIYLFTLRNFAVGTMLPKFDVVMTALLASVLFGDHLTGVGWLAVAAAVGGVMLIGVARHDAQPATGLIRLLRAPGEALASRPVQIGLATGLCFTFSYLFLREAGLSLGIPFVRAAAWTVNAVIAVQVIGLGLWLLAVERDELLALRSHLRPSVFVGLTSALGSIGWFTAMTMQNAALVKVVGQVEAIFALLISGIYFRERSNARELGGMALIILGVVLFLV